VKPDRAGSREPTGYFVNKEWLYQSRFKRVNGWRMHYIDEGADDPVVLLHGKAADGCRPARDRP
jgi:hypothetical protein